MAQNRALRRWLRALEHTYSPIVAILLGELAEYAFDSAGWQSGLLSEGLIFFWLLLVYRLVVTVLYAWQGERDAQRTNHRVVLPLFLFVLVFTTARVLSGIVDLAGIRLFSISDNAISLGSLYFAIVILYAFLLVSWTFESLLEKVILPRSGADVGLSNTIQTVTRYIVITAGILAALATLGIDFSTLAIIGAGLSVGIGFGLQELVANFISGILLLFEQSIRPGDIVEVEGRMGTVEKLRIRSTTVRTFDNVEVIIPNQQLLTSSVTTYTHTNRRIRIRMSIGASYDADPQEVRDALMTACSRHGLVLKEPAPLVFFVGYGASSIDFEIMVWVEDISTMYQTRSDLFFMIWREFEKRQIEIPYPAPICTCAAASPGTIWLTRFAPAAMMQTPTQSTSAMCHRSRRTKSRTSRSIPSKSWTRSDLCPSFCA
ncbi:MAG: mechanosensitive ion channel [Caldilineaceae bacterium]